MWMLSYEYRHHTSSLNHAQAVPDSDGLYRWVISAADPGVHNWLDGSGNACGSILLRWQHLPPGAQLAGCVRSEEHTSELQSLMRISYAVFCFKKKNTNIRPS